MLDMIPLPIVYDGVRNAELDIVSIPGLPTLSPNYKLKDQNQWLREVLSHQVPQARTMGFQYDFAKDYGNASWLSLLQQVERLLYSLIHRREGVESRPIIFVCYSFGAFIFKKVPVVESGVSKKDKMVECLHKDVDWTTIREVMENFSTLDWPFPVRILFKLKPSSIGSRHYVVKMIRECLCSEQVSALGWKNERLIGVQKDHAKITMYPQPSDEDGFFEQFMSTLTEIVGDVTTQTAPNQLSSTDFVGGRQSWTARGGLASSAASLAFESDGLGGMGKTQIAIRYAFQHRQTYKIVLWAHADGQSKFAEIFSLFADQLGLGAGMSNVNAKQAVKDCLEVVDVDWLLVFDNADTDSAQLPEEFWPRAARGSILITSRDHSLVKTYTGAELTEMSQDSAIDLLLKLTNFSESKLSEVERTEEESAAREIVGRVGYLPLGISQAATLIVTDSCSLGEFLDAYALRELVQVSADIRPVSSGNSYRVFPEDCLEHEI
ncbi:hypothetical protein ACJ41O_006532 [Fusarium nematophilum]